MERKGADMHQPQTHPIPQTVRLQNMIELAPYITANIEHKPAQGNHGTGGLKDTKTHIQLQLEPTHYSYNQLVGSSLQLGTRCCCIQDGLQL